MQCGLRKTPPLSVLSRIRYKPARRPKQPILAAWFFGLLLNRRTISVPLLSARAHADPGLAASVRTPAAVIRPARSSGYCYLRWQALLGMVS